MKNLYIDKERFGAFDAEVVEWDRCVNESDQGKFYSPLAFKAEEMFSRYLLNDHILPETGDEIYVEIELDKIYVFRCELLKVYTSFGGDSDKYDIFVDLFADLVDHG